MFENAELNQNKVAYLFTSKRAKRLVASKRNVFEDRCKGSDADSTSNKHNHLIIPPHLMTFTKWAIDVDLKTR